MGSGPAMMTLSPSEDARGFRDALGKFATGVTIVTTKTADGQKLGITANSFASVSLDPPLVLWSPAKGSRRYPYFLEAEHFAIHVLSKAQRDIAAAFVREANAFSGLDCDINGAGVPLINNCLARFECTQSATHDAGDHTVIIGRVTNCTVCEGEPIVFHSGTYGHFDPAN